MQQPDWQSRAFWEWAIEHCNASPLTLSVWFPEVGPTTWSKRKTSARAHHAGLVWPVCKRDPYARTRLPKGGPPDGWPEMAPDVGVGGVDGPREPAVPLTVEEKIARDREVARLKAERDEIGHKYRAVVRSENIYEKLAADGAEVLTMPSPSTSPAVIRSPRQGIRQALVLSFADWHIDETVDFDIMEGLNWYDPPTALRRVECMVDKTLLLANLSDRIAYPKLYIHDLGDNCTNFLHEDAKPTNSMTPLKGARFAAEVKARAIADLAPYFPDGIEFRGVPGNHGRQTTKMPWKTPTENLDWLIYQWTAALCRDIPDVSFTIPEAWSLTCDVEGWGFFLNHGTSDAKGGFGGISWYSLIKSDTKRTALDVKLGRKVLVRQYGHMHQLADVERAGGNGRIRIEPSLKGGDEFPKEGMSGTYSEPAQSLLEVHATEGLVAERSLNVRQYDTKKDCRYDALLELV